MRIINQNRSASIPLEMYNVFIPSAQHTVVLCELTQGGDTHTLGIYDDPQRAKEVFSEIMQRLEHGDQVYYLPDR